MKKAVHYYSFFTTKICWLFVITFSLGLSPVFGQLNITISGTNPTCGGFSSGAVYAHVSNGVPPFSFSWSNGGSTQQINNIPAGTYQVTVTDANSLTGSASTTLTAPSQISATATGSCTVPGSVSVSTTGGVPPYSYSWSNGVSGTSTITNLSPGQYCVTISDNNSCAYVACGIVKWAPTVTVSTNGTACNHTSGSATANPAGGSPPYSYLWSNGQTTQNISNVAPGNYSVTLTDNNGCTGTNTGTISNTGGGISVWLNATPPPCNGGNTGSITANAMGGTSPYTYVWSTGATTQTITGLGAGAYAVTVTDANGCTEVKNSTLVPPSGVAVSLNANNISCTNANNGAITATPSGGQAPYTYNWSNGASTQTINNLAVGTYTVTVTDNNGCIAIKSATISQSTDLTIDAEIFNILCFGDATGKIIASGWGGTPPYTYLWATGETTATIDGLTAGNYTVTVTDDAGCITTATFMISQPSTITININTSEAGCNGNNLGSATANAAGGTAPYTYDWSNGSSTQTINNLTVGSYIVTVTDANFCTSTSTAIVAASNGIEVVMSKSNITCFDGNNGSATATATTGIPPYSYSWNNGANTMTINDLVAGTYQVTITDDQGCTGTGSVVISQPTEINASIDATPLICGDDNIGTATVNANGGTAPYSYTWSNGQTGSTIDNLAPGTYSVTITDFNNCTKTVSTTINGNNNFTIDVATQDVFCNGEATGSLLVSGWGGVAPYTYEWDTGETTPELMNLTAGTYIVTVTDDAGCTIAEEVIINELPLLIVNIDSQNADCDNNGGSAKANALGGISPYTYAWSTGATTQIIDNLTAGTYSVTILDANFCTTSATITISGGTDIIVDVNTTAITCNNGNDGTASATVSGGIAPFTYNWSNGSTGPMINNLSANTYTVTVTDNNGCTAIDTGTVIQPDEIIISINTTNASCEQANGSATATASGGNAPYSYNWSNGQTTATIANQNEGTYMVTVTDANNCTSISMASIQGSSVPQVSISKTNASCFDGNDGTATAVATSGTAPYTYNWSNGQTTATISNLSAGIYDLTVTDNKGCTITGSIAIGQPNAINTNISKTDGTCANLNNGTAIVNANGGNAPYTYTWSNGATSQTIENLPAGQYLVTVTDTNNCTATDQVNINAPSDLLINIAKNDPNCFGINDGEIMAMVSGGTAPYSYNWSNGSTTSNIDNLAGGNYELTVIDANNCSETITVTLNTPLEISLSISVSGTCLNQSSGSATANASGGTGSFTYLWNTGATSQTINNLGAGSYSVTVTDTEGCTQSATKTLTAFPNPTCSINITNDISVIGGNDGALSASISGGTAPYTYNWSNGNSNPILNNLSAGIYSLTTTDANGCTSICSATLVDPNPCDNFTDPGSICCNQTLCGPGIDAAPITELSAPSGGSGAIEIIWMFSTTPGPFSATNFTIIPGANSPSYDPGPIYETTYIARCVRRAGCPNFVESNIITITVGNQAVAGITGPEFVCLSEPQTFLADDAGTGAIYEWSFPTGIPATATGTTVNNVIWNSMGIKEVTLNVTKNGCTSTDVLEVIVTNSAVWCNGAFIINVNPISQNSVAVAWEMEIGQDEEYDFEIERSADGVNFEYLGLRDPSQHNNHQFEYLDNSPKRGISFYRVKMIDMDGNFIYSNIVEARLLAGVGTAFIYPNPVTDYLYLEVIEDYNASDIELEIMTTDGIIIDNKNIPTDAVRTEIGLQDYPEGMYILVLKYNGQVQRIMKAIKQ